MRDKFVMHDLLLLKGALSFEQACAVYDYFHPRFKDMAKGLAEALNEPTRQAESTRIAKEMADSARREAKSEHQGGDGDDSRRT